MNDINDTNTDQQAFTLPESFQGNTAFEGIDSMEKLAQGFADTHQAHADLVAGQTVVPESADHYEINMGEGQEAHETLMPAFKGWMHEAGVSNDNAQIISDNFNSFIGDMVAANAKEAEIQETAQVDGLKKEWGSEFDTKAKVANDGLQRFFQAAEIGEDEQNAFAGKFGNDTTAIKLFHAIGKMIGESPHFDGDGNTGSKKGPGRTEGGSPMLHDYKKSMKL